MLFHFKIYRETVFVLLMCIMPSCLFNEEIPLDEVDFRALDDHGIEVVVNGAVTSLDSSQLVVLKTPESWDNIEGNQPIVDAEVTVTDGVNVYEYEASEHPDEVGYYYSVLPYKGVVGRTYTVTIVVNGKEYSASDTMVPMDKGNFKVPTNDYWDGEGGTPVYFIESHHFGYEQALRVKAGYIPQSNYQTDNFKVEPKMLSISDLLVSAGNVYSDVNFEILVHNYSPPHGIANSEGLAASLPAEENVTIFFYYMSFSPEYYQFLISLLNLTDWSNSVLAIQPANLLTNLSEGATGFFYATDVQIEEF